MMSARFGSGRAGLFAIAVATALGSAAAFAQPAKDAASSRKRVNAYDGARRVSRLIRVAPAYEKRTPVTDADHAAVAAAQAKRDRKAAKRLQVLARTQREWDGDFVTA